MGSFLPLSKEEAQARGWDTLDFVYVCGDAYVDHPSFGMALITRLLEAHGFSVGIISQPDWKDEQSIQVFGQPQLGFLVSSGNMDSMVNHYTVAKKRRHQDAYSPGGVAGLRPDHAVVVYSNLIRRVYKDSPIILGGIEASLRRLAHYDYWSDSLKRSILLDANADLISYGMGEHSIIAIAEALQSGLTIKDLTFIPGTVYRTRSLDAVYDYRELPSFSSMKADPLRFAESFAIQYENSDPFTGQTLVEPYGPHEFVVQNPPAEPLSTAELDAVYRLPFERRAHPSYEVAGGVPALSEVEFSLTANRGCFGECAFCALTFHQGRIVVPRSKEGLVEEAKELIASLNFKGYINDVGGPTANFFQPACKDQLTRGACKKRRCLSPQPCKKLEVDHTGYVDTLRALRKLPGVKKVFVRSGVRFDYCMEDPDPTFLRELVTHHVSGQLRVAPEHVSRAVLEVMGKPPHEVYERFVDAFYAECKRAGKEQYVVPYLMSSHPGSTLAEAVELAEFCRDMGFNPEQVQDFYPTPGSLATAMYFTGVDPRTMKPVYVARSPHEKALQRALVQYRNPRNADLVREALRRAGRGDLIGFDKQCLVCPESASRNQQGKAGASGSKGKRGKAGTSDSRDQRGKRGNVGASDSKRQPAKASASDSQGRRKKAGGSDSRGHSNPSGFKGKDQQGKAMAAPSTGKRGNQAHASSVAPSKSHRKDQARGSGAGSHHPRPQSRNTNRTKPPRARGHKGGIR